MKRWFVSIWLVLLVGTLSACLDTRKEIESPLPVEKPLGTAIDFSNQSIIENTIAKADGQPVWLLQRSSGTDIALSGTQGFVVRNQTGPANAALKTDAFIREDNYIFETSFQVDKLGAASRPAVVLIPRTKDFAKKQYYAFQYSMENGRLLWKLMNTAAPAEFNNASDPKREAPYIMKWGKTYTARIVINNVSENIVTLNLYVFDPDDPESGKKPLISYLDNSNYRIMKNADVGPQVGTSGSADVQPAVTFGGMKVYPFSEWDSLKDKRPAASAAFAAAAPSGNVPAAGKDALALPAVFSDRMVLQRNKTIPIWGKGTDGEHVTVQFAGQKAETTVKDGKWKVELAPLQAGGPYELVVHNNQKQIVYKDVLVGEVWVLSGQSNMQFVMKSIADPEDIRQANHDKIRLFSSRLTMTEQPQWDVPGGSWKAATPESVADFSATGYYFGLELQKKLGVPIGLISTAVGGTDIYMWMRPDIVKEFSFKAEPKRQLPSLLYNARIAPLQPYGIAGVAWWQGEQNASTGDKNYSGLFAALVNDWRKQWNQGDFPFIYVQLSSYNNTRFPALRDEQLLTLSKTENTGMAVTIDNGQSDNIHPRNKKETGYRLSLIARALAYGEKIEYMGPIYKAMTVKNGKAEIEFTHIGGGLMAKGERLKGFKMSGPDYRFVDAEAVIQGDRIVVSSDKVPAPVAVRYAYEGFPEVNLYNKEGLPASPFRTDRSE
ncbi:sialate O-acetylesterase [Paenibacillus allorhizosphaerae]|uniref:Sialate O-acetylesterase domain-containing protein n=1 Tax=Paenibacillus allorhizosphaerae TaxID=2849866 RepID=A0ABM8VAA8_9BACL|nr:sialate O-acetylesterase [Paenibacillus allorhizosphaerae]CAG7615963.1 hypothetical protein PAECIP111802_00232 [Paenibacillus allorhizosphaerae]